MSFVIAFLRTRTSSASIPNLFVEFLQESCQLAAAVIEPERMPLEGRLPQRAEAHRHGRMELIPSSMSASDCFGSSHRLKLGHSFRYGLELRTCNEFESLRFHARRVCWHRACSESVTMADVLIIEDESGLRESLLEGLSEAFPDLTFGAYGSVEEARGATEAQPPQLVISDVRLPGESGVEFLLAAKRQWPGTRFILITAYATLVTHEQASEYGAYRLLQKPFALHELVEGVQEALAADDSATVEGLTILDLLQIANLGKKSLAIYIRRGVASGEIFLRDGEVVHCRTGRREGVAAFKELVRWQRRDFEVRIGDKTPKTTIREPFHHLVLEALRILDEKNQESAEWESGRSSISTDEAIQVPHQASQPKSSPEPAATHQENTRVRASLKSLTTIDGFLGACLVDSESNKVLGAESDSFDVEVAAACNIEVIRAEQRVVASLELQDRIEDILITLGTQYHLLRPMDTNQELILYLVLDRRVANLAIARNELSTFVRGLDLGYSARSGSGAVSSPRT